MFYVKIHKIDGQRILVAVCDEELLGNKYSENGLQLDLTSSFYRGELMDTKALLPVLKKAYSFNAVGEKIVKLILKENLVSKSNIIIIKKIPHCQGLLIKE